MIQSIAMDVERAVADLAEVRLRLVTLQRFDGVSGQAAIASGVVAVLAGIIQRSLIPLPATGPEQMLYLEIWLGCLVVALGINYGAILSWLAHERRLGARGQVRNVGPNDSTLDYDRRCVNCFVGLASCGARCCPAPGACVMRWDCSRRKP